MESDELQCQGGLPEVIGLVVDPGDEIVDGAPAQDAWQPSVALDDGIVNLDDHLRCQINHAPGLRTQVLMVPSKEDIASEAVKTQDAPRSGTSLPETANFERADGIAVWSP